MLIWILSIVAALLLAAFLYLREARSWTTALSAFLRVIAVLLAVALALDAPRGRANVRAPVVVVDASASWRRGRPDSVWRNVLAKARAAAGGDTVWLVGDSLRPLQGEQTPGDAASRVDAAVDRALGSGRPLVLMSDGEIDDPTALDRLLAGSRVEIAPVVTGLDAAVVSLELPRSVVGGDTADIVVRVAAGAGGAAAGTAAVTVDHVPLVRIPLEPLAANTERDLHARVRIPAEGGEHRVIRAVLSDAGDVVATNDTLAAALDVAASPKAVFASTSPDPDARFSLEVLRGTLAIAVRAFYRVAPGMWRQEPGFAVATEADVRKALAEAPIAILHGDTALFGAPRALTIGSLALMVPGSSDGEEWYPVAAPVSPLSAAFEGLPWDSLPPVTLAAPARGDWTALSARRPRTLRDERSLITGSEKPRRVVVIGGSGFWRWRFRGGASADAYTAMWGGIFDWMAAGGDDRRSAVPAAAWTRTGDPVVWRRGPRRDSIVTAVVRSVGGKRVDSVTLRFPGNATLAESPSLPVGEYDVTLPGGTARLVIAASREWLPKRPTVKSGAAGTARVSGLAPRLRDWWWVYVVVVVALCAEWVLRRRAGLR